ncbi:hypothetical protein HanXRQr2_Chr02g0051531 [Helianthus annuus]|uniref:Uncharacterized protein n=1 Tax=Helianthus annuus TaxID=4232 RepID=A0A9K3NYL6_HELAN|nr:hypothetical protein HanXRQr2_Chr02g0051531 [Helianthus annuus]
MKLLMCSRVYMEGNERNWKERGKYLCSRESFYRKRVKRNGRKIFPNITFIPKWKEEKY